MTTTIAPVQFKIIDGPSVDAILNKFKSDDAQIYFVCIREDDEVRNIGSEPVDISANPKKLRLVPLRIRRLEWVLSSLGITMDVPLSNSGFYKSLSLTYNPQAIVRLNRRGKMTGMGTFHLEHIEAKAFLR